MSSTTEQERNNYFQKNLGFVSGLMHYIPEGEKRFVKNWIKKLMQMKENEDEQLLRNDYIWLLLIQLLIGKLTKPFIGNPVNKLAPISISEKQKYQKMLTESDKEARATEEVSANNLNATEVKFENPSDFSKNQPIPKKGFYVYGSCFSHPLE